MKPVNAYSASQTDLDKMGMNSFFEHYLGEGSEICYDAWEETYRRYLSTLERKHVPVRQHWLLEQTWVI